MPFSKRCPCYVKNTSRPRKCLNKCSNFFTMCTTHARKNIIMVQSFWRGYKLRKTLFTAVEIQQHPIDLPSLPPLDPPLTATRPTNTILPNSVTEVHFNGFRVYVLQDYFSYRRRVGPCSVDRAHQTG